MKKVYLILLWLLIVGEAMAQQPYIFQGNYTSGQHTINQATIETGTTGTTHVGGSAQVDLRANNSIRLLPGFSAGGFTNGGYFSASIAPGGSRRDTTICKGQQIAIGDSAEMNVTYHWFPSIGLNDTSIAMPLANPDSTTNYVVHKLYPNGTFIIDTFVIFVNPTPIANAGVDTIIESGMELSIGQLPIPGVNYSWNSNYMLSDSTISNPLITGLNEYPFERSFSKVLTAERNGCISIDSMIIRVLPAPNYFRFDEGFCNTENKLIYGMSKLVRNVPNPLPSNSYIMCGNGKFRVTFQDIILGQNLGFADPNLGITRQNCVCAVLDYVESVISIPNNIGTTDPPIDLLFDESYNDNLLPQGSLCNQGNATSTILAEAAPNFPNTTQPGYYSGNLAQHIQTGILPEPGVFDAEIRANFASNIDFSYCNSDQIGDCQFDFFGTILHEVTHALGFISSVVPIRDNQTCNISIESYLGPNIYTKFDEHFLYMFNGLGFDKVVDISAFGTNGGLNPIVTTSPLGWLQNNNVWLDDTDLFQQKTNQPIPPGNISHFLIDFRNRNSTSPGFIPNYVMNFFLDKHHRLKEYTLQDLRALKVLGYNITSNTVNFNNINNIPPFSTDILMNSTNQNVAGVGLFKNQTPPGGNVNSYISTTICNPVVVDLNTKTISNGTQTITLNIQDVENDQLSVYEAFPGSKGVYNIRGCGNGGNNSNQLSINTARNIITFTPRSNFIGRAQFGFQLYDGHEKGSYIVISVEVAKGTCFTNAPDANEIIINGSFEEGSEIRLTTEPSRTLVDEIDVQGYYLESAIPFDPTFRTLSSSYLTMFDAKQVNENWDLPIVRNSSQSCLFENSSCFGSCSSNPMPDPALGGNRYNLLNLTNTLNRSFNLTLSEDIISCKKYILEADFRLNSGPNSSGNIAFNFHNSSSGINYIYSGQGNPDYNYSSQFPLSNLNLNNWVHMSIPVEIPSNVQPSKFLMLSGDNIGNTVNVFVDNVSLKEVTEITITPDGPTTFCQGGSVPLTSSLASPIQWYLNGAIIQGATNQTYTATVSGDYSVGYGSGTCPPLMSQPITITVNPNPSILNVSASGPLEFCEELTVVLTATLNQQGNYFFSWFEGNSILPNELDESIVIGSSGTYSVKVVDENGCFSFSENKDIVVYSNPQPSISGLDSHYCLNSQSVNLIGTPAGTGGSFSGLGITGDVFTPSVAGIGEHDITYTFIDEHQCVGSSTLTTQVYGLPDANAGIDRDICIGESTQLGTSSTAFTSYSWSIGNSTPFSTLSNPSVSPTSTTTYTLSSTNTILGCSNSNDVTVTVHQLPIANAGSDVTICQNGSVQLSGSGGVQFAWSPSTGLSSSSISNPIASPLTATTYNLTVTDAYGCTSSNSDEVQVSINNLSATYTTEVNTEKPCELPASATLFPTGGTAPYTILWPSGGTGLTETGLYSGNYPVVIEDATGCTFELNVLINTCCFSRTFNGPVRFIDNMHSTSLGSDVSENSIVISGNFTINNNFRFFNQQEVVLLEGARITLEGTQSDPVEFKVTDNSRLHGCNQMWESISADNTYEKISIINDAIVEDAKNAIYCKKCNLNLNQAHLNKNYIHVTLENSNAFNATDYTFNPILKSTFTCNLSWNNNTSANLLPPYSSNTSSYMAINAGKYTVVTIGDGTDGNKNIFKRSLFGIYSNSRGKLKVLTNEFSEISYGILHNGPSLFQVDGNDFKQIYGVGIYPFRGWDSNNTIEITNNTHSNGTGWAIVSYGNNRKKTKITGNTIDCSSNSPSSGGGISVFETASNNQDLQIENNTISEAYSGIWLSNIQGKINITALTSSAFVNNNTITHRKAVSDNNGLSGIYLQNCSRLVLQYNHIHAHDGNPEWWESGIRQDLGTTNFLLCNDVKDIGRGLLLLGDLTPLQVLARNQMGNNQTGLFINKIGQQGWSGFPYDNEWDPNFTWGNNENFATVVYDDDLNPPTYNGNDSKFYVQSSSLPYMPPTISNLTQGQGINQLLTVPFVATTGSLPISCPIFTSPSFMVSHPTVYKSMAAKVLNDTIRTGERDINEKWMSKYGLYSLMESDSVLQSDSTLKAFYDSSFVSNMGVLNRASNLLTLEPEGKTIADIAEFADTLNTLTPSNNTEENWMNVLNIMIDNILDSTSLESSEISALRSIAALCPFEDGFGVYMARAALIQADTLPDFVGFNDCEPSPLPPSELRREETSMTSISNTCNLYPNPTDNILIFEYLIANEVNGMLEVFDITGKKILSKTLLFSESKATIELGNCSPGIYFIKVYGVMSTQINYKVTVLK